MNWHRLFVVIFAVTVLAGSSSWAVDMFAKFAFTETIAPDSWTPVNILLENDTGKDLKGTLAFVLEWSVGQNTQLISCAPEVNLPAGAEKEYQAYICGEPYGDSLRITLNSGFRTIAQTRIRCDASDFSYSDVYSVATVGKADKRLAFLSGLEIGKTTTPTGPKGSPFSGGPGATDLQVGWMEQSNLPDRPAGYSGLNMLVLSDFRVSASAPEVLNAIKAWVAGGGTLVIPSGADYNKLKDPDFFGELLPVSVVGAEQASGIKTLEAACGAPPIGPIALARSVEIPGKCIYSEKDSGQTILAVGQYGAGKVVFLAFDPGALPFRNWPGQTEFWKRLITRPAVWVTPSAITVMNSGSANRSSLNQRQMKEHLAVLVSENPAIELPPVWVVWVFLAAYIIVLVPVNYFVLKAKKKLELAWISVPVIVAVFTLGAYGIGYSVKGGQILLNQASVLVTSKGAGTAAVNSVACLFSPSRRSYHIELPDASALGYVWNGVVDQHGIGRGMDSVAPSALISDKVVWETVKLPMWATEGMESRSGIELGGTIESSVRLSSGVIKGTIANNTKYDLKDCYLVFQGHSQRIDDLPAGKSVNVDISANVSGAVALPPGSMPLSGMPSGMIGPPVMPAGNPVPQSQNKKKYRRSMAEELRGIITMDVKGQPGVLLVARINAGSKFTLVSDAPKTEYASCIVVKLQ